MQEEISLMELFKMLKKHLAKIIVSTILGAIVSTLVMFIAVTPKYESTAQLLVNQQGSNDQQIQYSEIQTNVALINTYRDMIKSDAILGKVSQNINEELSVGSLKEAVNVKQESNSQAFNITATTKSAELSQKIVQNLVAEFETILRDVYGDNISSIYVLSPASYNPKKVSPSLIMFIFVGGLLGLVISVIYVLVVELSDNTLKDTGYVTDLGLMQLGEIFELTEQERRESLRKKSQGEKVRKRV